EVSLAHGLLPFVFFGRIASVDDPDAAIFAKLVGCRHTLEPLLKRMVQPRDLEPGSQIPIQFEVVHRLHPIGSAQAAAYKKSHADEQKETHSGTGPRLRRRAKERRFDSEENSVFST